MKYIHHALIAAVLFMGTHTPLSAQTTSSTDVYRNGLHLQTLMGSAKSANNRLILYPNDRDAIRIDAQYDSRSDSDSSYWDGRIELWNNNEAWGLELIHHKIYLRNPQQGLEEFSISDGYNLAYLTKGWRINEQDAVRLGLGLVFAHPDVTLSGRTRFHEPGFPGMFLAGPTIMASYEKRFFSTENHFISIEGKVTASYAHFPISDSHDDEFGTAPDLAFHISIGFGSLPLKKEASLVDYALYALPALYPTVTAKVFNMK